MSGLETRPAVRGAESLSTLQHWAKFVKQVHRDYPGKSVVFRGTRDADGGYRLEVAAIRDRPPARKAGDIVTRFLASAPEAPSRAARARVLADLRQEVLADLRQLRARTSALRPAPYESVWAGVFR